MKQNNNQKPKKMPSQSKNVAKRVAKNIIRDIGTDDAVMQAIMRDLAAPGESGAPAIRLSGDDDTAPSAVASLQLITNPVCGAISDITKPYDTAMFAFRDPLRAQISLEPSTLGYTYNSPTITQQLVAGQVMSINPGYFGYSGSGNAVHGDVLFCGSIGTIDRFFWLSGSDSLSVTNNSGQALTISLFAYSKGKITQSSSVSCAASTTTVISSPGLGYYCMRGSTSQVTLFTYVLNFSITLGANVTNPPVWGHKSLPFMFANIGSVDALRITSFSAKLSNDSSPLYKEGRLVAYQLNENEDWRDYQTFAKLASLNAAVSLPAENGIYIFAKPNDVGDFTYQDYTDTNVTGVLVNSTFNLLCRSFLAIAGYFPNVSGQDLRLTTRYNVNYTTHDPWRSLGYPQYRPSVIAEAKYLLARVPNVYENPLHLGEVFSWIKDTVKSGFDYLTDTIIPTVVRIGETAAKVAPYVAGAAALI
jgi:hypothetical protein